MSSVLSFLPRLLPEDLVAFTQYCFFDPDASSFRALELAQLRYDLLHAILSALDNTDVPELTLFSRLQDAVAVTLTLHTDFFETHVAEPLEEQVAAAFAQGMALSQIEAAVRLLQRSYGTTTEDVMIQLTLRFVEETLKEAVKESVKEEENKEKEEEEAVKEEENKENAVVTSATLVASLLSEEKEETSTRRLTAGIIALLEKFATSPNQPRIVKELLYVCVSNQTHSDFAFALLRLLLPSNAPSLEELVADLVHTIAVATPESIHASVRAVESALEFMGSPSVYHALLLSPSVASVLPWCDADAGVVSCVAHGRLYDNIALASVGGVMGCEK